MDLPFAASDTYSFFVLMITFGILILGFAIIIIFFDVALKIGIISRNYQIKYNCRLLTVEKSALNFKKLSRISNLKSKQQIWKFCSEVNK